MTDESRPFDQREPFEPPKQRWRPWHSPRWQRFLQIAAFPRGRYFTRVVGAISGWIVVYNTGALLLKGPDHPSNNLRWKLARDRGLLTPEMLKKEETLHKFDLEPFHLLPEAFPFGHKSPNFEAPVLKTFI